MKFKSCIISKKISLSKAVDIIGGSYVGQILATPYGIHAGIGCTPHMGDPYMDVCWALAKVQS